MQYVPELVVYLNRKYFVFYIDCIVVDVIVAVVAVLL